MEQKKICLDTDICIGIIKGNKPDRIEELSLQKVFISSVSVFELFLRESKLTEVENFIEEVEIIDFNEAAAKKASEIFKDLRKKGLIIDHRDIFIAAACIANNCSLLTLNKKHFDKIDELNLINLK